MSASDFGQTKEDLERQKLEVEIRLLRQQKRWEARKSLATIAIPLLTLAALVGGGWKYFQDESERIRIRMEEVFSLGLKNLDSQNAFVRLAAVTSLLSYARRDQAYDGRVIAVLAMEATEEPSVMVRQTILGNFRRLKAIDKRPFEDFLASVQGELKTVRDDLGRAHTEGERTYLEDERKTLERVEQVLRNISG